MMVVWNLVRRVPDLSFPIAAVAVCFLIPTLTADGIMARNVQLVLILALVVSGLNLALGYAGELAAGQAAMYAAGAYTAGLLSIEGVTDIAIQILAGGLAALVVGIITGVPGLRLDSWSLGMASFFLVLLIPDLVAIWPQVTGAQQGLVGIQVPTLFGTELTPDQRYYLVVGVALVWFVIFRNIITSRHGVAFQVLKKSPVLASSVGMSVYRSKLVCYAIGAIPAGLAGALFANLDLFVYPDNFNFHFATMVLVASVLGGAVSIYGAFIGAAVVVWAQQQQGAFSDYSQIVFGAFLILCGAAFSGGIADLLKKGIARLDRAAHVPHPHAVRSDDAGGGALVEMTGQTLVVDDVAKAFGGNRAVDGVSLTAAPGRVTALIGPNGSGKTTLLNLICRYYPLDRGAIRVGETDIARVAPHQVSRLGIARTFQTPLVPTGLTVREVVTSGRYISARTSFAAAILRTPGFRHTVRGDRQRADLVMRLVGLDSRAEQEAASLPLGPRRMLEVARALVSAPRVLLLDEIASGLDEGELEVLAEVIRRIRDSGCTVVLVEHNFQLVLSLADHIVVLARGQVLATGSPAEIESNAAVRNEYLGHSDAVVASERLAEMRREDEEEVTSR